MESVTFNISRRSFLNHTAKGMAATAICGVASPFINTARAKSRSLKTKKLLATTDFIDNVFVNNCFFEKSHLDELNKYLASIGVTRHQWIVSDLWTMYDNYPHGFDLLAEAVESAHAHGLEFYALIKPFEEGGFRPVWPHSLPFPKGAVAFKDMRGIKPFATQFAARHPDMCLKRRPGTFEFRGPVTSIRLVKNNDTPTRVKVEHLSIWTSPSNNGFVPYNGPVSFRESVEWRTGFPKWQQCRILHLEGLKIPKNHTHILVRCSLADEEGDFTNEIAKIIELVGPDGENIPSTLSTGPGALDINNKRIFQSWIIKQRAVRYLELPEVQKELNDPEKIQAHYRNFYNFDRYNVTDLKTLDKDGYVAAACGKPEYMPGNLHPIYPEVREHWLDLTRYCLDRGVDGINFRAANHTQSPEYWEYGFNEAVIEAAGGRTDYPTIQRINGNAYTQFLRQARNLIKSRGKSMTLHIYAQMLAPDDRRGRLSYLPPNFEWQWETWVREIADDLEFRGVFTLQPWHAKQVLETITSVTRAAKKPLYFQGKFHELTFDGPNHRTREELDLIRNDPGVDGFVLYETGNYTRINKEGRLEGSSDIKTLMHTHFFRQDKDKQGIFE